VHSAPRHPQTNGQIERHNGFIKGRVKAKIASGASLTEVKEYVRVLIADKNMEVHATTKHIPYELQLGILVDHDEEVEEEERNRILTVKSKEAYRNIVAAAEYAKEQWKSRKRKGVYEYTIGEKVWVKWPKKFAARKDGAMYVHTATIEAITEQQTYQLLWGELGGYNAEDKPFSLSKRCYSGTLLKPYYDRAMIRCMKRGMLKITW
jgi:hypothetical protein